MTAITAESEQGRRMATGASGNLLLALAWRNLWRNRRRTWLTACGIAFAVWMLVFAWSMNDGTFDIMIDTAARTFSGHVALQHPDYQEEPTLEHVLSDAPALLDQAKGLASVKHAAPRAMGTALLSVDERSFGAQIVGVVPEAETGWSTLASSITDGRYLQAPGEIVLGAPLARNLHASVGSEVVMLGTALEGGVAAAAAQVVGIFDTGQVAMDRSLAEIHIADFRDAWRLRDDQAHVIALVLDGPRQSDEVASQLAQPGLAALPWSKLMLELVQMVDLKRSGQGLFFVLIAVIVVFSVVNTFMMTVFERTPELGMLRALGMRGGQLQTLLHIEALWLSILGISVGLLFTWALLAALSGTGIPLPEETRELVAAYHMPDRLYPAYSWGATCVAAAAMLLGTQLAVLIPAFRVRRMQPVDALRKED